MDHATGHVDPAAFHRTGHGIHRDLRLHPVADQHPMIRLEKTSLTAQR